MLCTKTLLKHSGISAGHCYKATVIRAQYLKLLYEMHQDKIATQMNVTSSISACSLQQSLFYGSLKEPHLRIRGN